MIRLGRNRWPELPPHLEHEHPPMPVLDVLGWLALAPFALLGWLAAIGLASIAWQVCAAIWRGLAG